MAVTVGLLGDAMLGRAVAWKLASIPPQDLWAPELRALFSRCDLVVANLECCVSQRGHKTRRIAGKPFVSRAPLVATVALHAIGARAVSLANNHFPRTGLAEGADADWIAARLSHACAELGTSVERLDAGRFAVAG